LEAGEEADSARSELFSDSHEKEQTSKLKTKKIEVSNIF
jgi:hypothetical protein